MTPSEYTYRSSAPSGLDPANENNTPATEDPNVNLTFEQGFSRNDEADHYNFAIGPIRFSMAAGFGVEFNDNINLSDHNRESDIILRPQLNVDALWHISDLNTLRFSIGVGYAKYLQHTENDTRGVLISPTSELALQAVVGPVHIRVRDRLSYQEDTYDVPDLSNVSRYRHWENQAGIVADWDVNAVFTVTAGYDHYNLWTEGGGIFHSRGRRTVFDRHSPPQAEFQRHANAQGRRGRRLQHYQFRESSPSGRRQHPQPDHSWIGRSPPKTDFYIQGGYQQLHFDGSTRLSPDVLNQFAKNLGLNSEQRAAIASSTQDFSDSNSWYLRFELNNKLSDVFQQRLSGSKTSEIGFFTNIYDLYHIEYSADYTGIPDTEFGPTVFYAEYYKSSGPDPEKANRIGAGFGIRRYLTKSVTLGLDYRFLWKDSNIPGADYYQNLAFLSIYYKF